MSNDATISHADVIDPDLTNEELLRLERSDFRTCVMALIDAMQMQQPVSPEKAFTLIRHIVRDRIAADPLSIAGQMRIDHWESGLANGDNMDVLAERACAFFRTEQGAAAYRFFEGAVLESSTTPGM